MEREVARARERAFAPPTNVSQIVVAKCLMRPSREEARVVTEEEEKRTRMRTRWKGTLRRETSHFVAPAHAGISIPMTSRWCNESVIGEPDGSP